MSDTSNNFVIPIQLTHTSNAKIYGETKPTLLYEYQFDSVLNVISLEQMKATFKYKDNGDSNSVLLKYDVNDISSITLDQWHSLIVDNSLSLVGTKRNYRNSNAPPLMSKLSNQVIQWITSTLFGHPQAQAPLSNENEIILDISNGSLGGKLGKQLYDALKNGISDATGNEADNNAIVKSIYEQMIDVGRFDISGGDSGISNPTDVSGFIPLPFKRGDKLSFLIKIYCNLFNEDDTLETTDISGSNFTNLSSLFNNINGVNTTSDNVSLIPETWKFTYVLS